MSTPWNADDVDPLAVAPDTEALDRIKFGAMRILDGTALTGLQNPRLETRLTDFGGQLAVRLRGEILGKQHPPQIVSSLTTVPRFATPWQHLKARYAGRWWARRLVRRWPVRFVDEPVKATVTVRPKVLYPHGPRIALPEFGAPVLYFDTSPAMGVYERRAEDGR